MRQFFAQLLVVIGLYVIWQVLPTQHKARFKNLVKKHIFALLALVVVLFVLFVVAVQQGSFQLF